MLDNNMIISSKTNKFTIDSHQRHIHFIYARDHMVIRGEKDFTLTQGLLSFSVIMDLTSI